MNIELFMKKVDKKPYPKHWKEFVAKHYIEQNIFFKFGNKCLCTNCQHEFKSGKGFNIGELKECPNCHNKFVVFGNSLYYRYKTFRKDIIMCQKVGGKVVIRVFEIASYFNSETKKMIRDEQEYAREILGVGTFHSDAICFYLGYGRVYHYGDNTCWRSYDGVRDYAVLPCYPYNKQNLKNNTIMEYAPIEEFLKENPYCNYLQALKLAAYPSFESLWKLGLKNLSQYSYKFKKTGTFKKRFGISKNHLPFMVKNDLTYDEFNTFKVLKKEDMNLIKAYKSFTIPRLRKLKKTFNLEHVELVSQLNLIKDEKIEYVLNFVNARDLGKYKQIKDNFSIYYDYLTFIEKLGFDMKEKKYLFPKNLKSLHDKYAQEISVKENIIISTAISQRFLDLSPYIYENEKYIIYPAPTFYSLEEESSNMGHCVRSYAERYSKGATEIFFMREKSDTTKSLVTVEFNNKHIIQKRQKGNANTTIEQNEFLYKWENFRNKKRKIKLLEPTRDLLVA